MSFIVFIDVIYNLYRCHLQSLQMSFVVFTQSNFFSALWKMFANLARFVKLSPTCNLSPHIIHNYATLCNIICQLNYRQLSPQKRLFTTIRRRICGDISAQIIQCCIKLYNFITQCCIILHPAAKQFDWVQIAFIVFITYDRLFLVSDKLLQ